VIELPPTKAGRSLLKRDDGGATNLVAPPSDYLVWRVMRAPFLRAAS
jgi:hypothetical protein